MRRNRLSRSGSKKKTSRMRKVATAQIGDGKTPNKYWVSVSSDYYIYDPKENLNDWASEVKGIKVKGKTLKTFKTYEEAKRFADGIEFGKKISGVEVNTVSVEDRLTGEVYERSLNQEPREDIEFTMKTEKELGVKSSIRKGITDNLYAEELYRLYDGSIPSYLNVESRNKIKIMAEQWEGAGEKWITITPKDVVEYYRTDARNITSGARSLAGFSSDWRMVDNMAKESLEIFKVINPDALKREARKYGMELKG